MRKPGPAKPPDDLGEHNIVKDLLKMAVRVADLDEMPGNPRRGDVEAIAESYREFGQAKPVVVWRGELPSAPGVAKRYVIDGNHQLMAARDVLGWEVIAASDVSHLPLGKALAYAAFINRVPELGVFDEQELAVLLQQIDDTDVDLVTAGYSEDDLAYLLAGLETDGGVELVGTSQDHLDDYLASGVRSVVLPYELAEYEEVQRLLSELRERTAMDSNADVVLAALREAQ